MVDVMVDVELVRPNPTQLTQNTSTCEQLRRNRYHKPQHGQAAIPKFSLLTPSPLNLTIRCHHLSVLEVKCLPILMGFPAN